MKYFTISLTILLFHFSQLANAQQGCRSTLQDAEDYYEQGLFTRIPDVLQDCIEEGFNRAERIEAYKLIILSYLSDDDAYGAERAMNEFLKKYPEYEIMPKDPVEFVYLFESYKTSAIFSISALFGPTVSYPLVTERYSAINASTLSSKSRPGIGFFIGMGVSYDITTEMALHLESLYTINRYEFVESNSTNTKNMSLNSEITKSRITEISFKESLHMFNFPLTLTYKFGSGNISYFARGGLSVGFVTSVTATPTKSHGQSAIELTETDIDISDLQSTTYFSGIAGGGARIKVPRGFVSIDARLHFGINNMTNKDTRFNNQVLTTKYLYVPDNYNLFYFSLGVGYNFSLYRSRKY